VHAAAPAAALPEETATQTSGERVYMDPGAAARTWAAQTSTRRPHAVASRVWPCAARKLPKREGSTLPVAAPGAPFAILLRWNACAAMARGQAAKQRAAVSRLPVPP